MKSFIQVFYFTLIAVIFIISQSAGADDQSGLAVTNSYIRLMPPSATTTAMFFEIKNNSSADIALVSASSDLAAMVEIHSHKKVGQVFQMREIKSVNIPSHQTVSFKPGGYHIMFMNLSRKILEGQKINVKLNFNNKSSLTLAVPVSKK